MKVGQIVKLKHHQDYYKILGIDDNAKYIRVQTMSGMYKDNVKLVPKSFAERLIIGHVSVAQDDLTEVLKTIDGLRGFSYKAIWSAQKQYGRLNENCELLCMTCRKLKEKFYFKLSEKSPGMPISHTEERNTIVWIKDLLWKETTK